jgi:hypothetical protein
MSPLEVKDEEGLIHWMVPPDGAHHEGVFRSRGWWEKHVRLQLRNLRERYRPEGFVLAENQLMGSSRFGQRHIIPFGGLSSNPAPPENPFSIDGTASGTLCVVGIHRIPS